MKQAWRFVRQWWWAFVAVAATVFLVVWRFTSKSGTGTGGGAEPVQPSVADRAKAEVERVRLEGEIEKAKVTATADAHRAEIDRIEEVGKSDPKEARRQLAGWLGRNL
jgi:hypothetical protein